MATAVQIEVTMDESGAVSGVRSINNSFNSLDTGAKKAGVSGEAALRGVTARSREAREAAMLLTDTIGVRLPAGIAKVISQMPGLGTALRAGFSAAAVVGITAAVLEFINNLDLAKKKFDDFTTSMAEGALKIRDYFAGDKSPLVALGEIRKEQELLTGATDRYKTSQAAAMTAGLQGYAALAAQMKAANDQIDRATSKDSTAAHNKYGDDSEITQAVDQQLKALATLSKQANFDAYRAQVSALSQSIRETMTATWNDVAAVGKSAFEQIALKENTELSQVGGKARQGFNAGQLTDAARQRGLADLQKLSDDYSQYIQQSIREAGAQSVQGYLSIEVETENKIASMRKDFQDKWGNNFTGDPKDPQNEARMQAWVQAQTSLQQAIWNVEQAGDRQRQQLHDQTLNETVAAEQSAAEAITAPWARAGLQIRDQYQARLTEITDALQNHLIDEENAVRQINAAWTQMQGQVADNNRQMVDQLAGDLESIFSGNVLDNILQRFKHMFFQIAASWLLTLTNMQSGGAGGGVAASGAGGGGGLFGSILGSLFGIKGSGGGTGGAIYSTPPFVGNSAFDMGSGAIGSFGGGGINGDVVGGSGVGGAAATMLAGLGTGAGLSSGSGTAALAQSQQVSSSMASTVGGSLLQQLTSKVFTHGISLGNFSLSGSAVGMAGAGIGLSSIMGAYSSGSKLLGTLGGAAGGALLGFSVGGPLGAGIGAAVGAIAGLLSGIFGGRKRTDEARNAANQLYVQLDQIKASYYDHQTDYGSALSQIDQLQSQAQQALGQYGSQGRSVFNNEVVPHITAVTAAINDIENQRQSRSLINLQPTQFATGGLVTAMSGPRTANGAVLIAAHPGEYVVNPASTSANRGSLDAINRGTSSGGGGDVYLTVQTTDPKSFYQWLRAGGIGEVKKAWVADNADYAGAAI
jgi:gas vesicle protein